MCSIDPIQNRLIMRYHLSDGRHIAVYDLAEAISGDFTNPLADIKHPYINPESSVFFQGYAAYDQYIYFPTGNSYTSGAKVNSEITTIDMNTGEVVRGPTLTKAGSTRSFRELEEMTIYESAGGEVRLFLGFALGKAGDRRSNLFYKNALVLPTPLPDAS